jgi:hypothetical protein
MDLTFLFDYLNAIIFGICLCVGFILKNAIKTDKINGYIPLIMGCLGVVLGFWTKHTMTPEVLLMGLFSGLASTGAYELFRNLIEKGKK